MRAQLAALADAAADEAAAQQSQQRSQHRRLWPTLTQFEEAGVGVGVDVVHGVDAVALEHRPCHPWWKSRRRLKRPRNRRRPSHQPPLPRPPLMRKLRRRKQIC